MVSDRFAILDPVLAWSIRSALALAMAAIGALALWWLARRQHAPTITPRPGP